MKNLWEGFKDLIFEPEDKEEELPEEEPAGTPDIPFNDIDLNKEAKRHSEPVKAPEPAKPAFVTLKGPAAPSRPEPEKPKLSAAQRAKETTSYQFTQVISPIWGLKDAKPDAPQMAAEPAAAHPAAKSALGTILSPMYGPIEEAKPVKVPKELARLGVEDVLDAPAPEAPKDPAAAAAEDYNTENMSFFDDEEQ